MVTLKLFHASGQKETVHFQSIEKCSLWMNLHYKKLDKITLIDGKKNEKFDFPSKHSFEEFCKKRIANEN